MFGAAGFYYNDGLPIYEKKKKFQNSQKMDKICLCMKFCFYFEKVARNENSQFLKFCLNEIIKI